MVQQPVANLAANPAAPAQPDNPPVPADQTAAGGGAAQQAQAPDVPVPRRYVLVNGHTNVMRMAALTEDAALHQILHWISFTVEAHRENIKSPITWFIQ